MTKEKARVVLSNKVWRQIDWLTRNFNKEIAAVGTVEIREGKEEKYFFIDSIYFPEQEVTGATVDLSSEMWGTLIQEVPKEDLGRLNFYWHRHPGSAHHSGTDEEKTFGAFMDKDANREFFIFMQTAVRTKTQAEMDIEARIDIRTPVRATILDDNISVKYLVPSKEHTEEFVTAVKELAEQFREEDKLPSGWAARVSEVLQETEDEPLKEELEAIIEERVKTKTFQSSNQRNLSNNRWNKTDILDSLSEMFGSNKTKPKKNTLKNILELSNEDAKELQPLAVEEKVSLNFRNGAVKVSCGKLFHGIMEVACDEGGRLKEFVRSKSTQDKNGYWVWNLQPAQSSYYPLKGEVLQMFRKYNTALKKKKEAEEANKPSSNTQDNGNTLVIQNDMLVYDIIGKLEEDYELEWDENKLHATVHASDDEKNVTVKMGTFEMESGGVVTVFKGVALVEDVKKIQTELLQESAQELEELTK